MRAFDTNSVNSVSPFSLKSRPGKHLAAGAIALGLLFVVAANTQAQTQTNYWWTGAANDGNWQNPTNWVLSNFVATATYPGVIGANAAGDYTTFTNSGTYSVSINSGANLSTSSNIFSAATGTVATVTLTLNGTAELNPYVSDPDNGLIIAEGSNETVYLYVASSSIANGLQITGDVDIGHDGNGALIVTNGYVNAHATDLGTGTGQGTLTISGPNTYWDGYQFSIGNTNASYGDTLIISNSASVTCSSTFRVGSSSSTATSNCLFIVTSGAFFSVSAGAPCTVGNRATVTGTAAYNNTAIIGPGGIWDNTNHTLAVGTAANDETGFNSGSAPASGTIATGNLFVVEAGGFGNGFSQVCITPSNTFAIYGGIFGGNGVALGNITNYGVFEGWGTIIGSLNTGSNIFGTGFTVLSNSVGPLVLSNSFTLATNAVLQMSLGTNYYPIAVGMGSVDPIVAASPALTNNIALNGTLNFVDSGGFTSPHTYTLITYPASVLGNYTNGAFRYLNTFSCSPTIGSVPNTNLTYVISTNTPGQINLIVTGSLGSSLPPQITSITRTNSNVDGNNDILIKWNTNGSTNNHVLVTTGTANGSYSTNSYVNLADIVVTTATTNYLDIGGVTNTTTGARYYRISSP